MNGYSQKFLEKYAEKLESYVELVVNSNPDAMRLSDLIAFSHMNDESDPLSVSSCASKVQCPVQIVSGSHDRIAGAQACADLAESIQNRILR